MQDYTGIYTRQHITIQDSIGQKGLFQTIQDYIGIYGTIQDPTGLYRPKLDSTR